MSEQDRALRELLKKHVAKLRFILAAVGPAAIALVIQSEFWGLISPFAWFLFCLTVFTSAWVGGVFSGIISTFLSTAIVWFYFLPATYQVSSEGSRLLSTTVFFGMGIIISVIRGRLERANRQALISLQKEEQARRTDIKFRMLAETVPQIVWITDPGGLNIFFNQKWVDYTGMTMEESSGHGWNKPFHPDDQQRAWEAWRNAVKTGGVYSLECRLRRKDGTYHWWLIRGEALHDQNGKIVNWFGTCTDVEEIKQAEAALKRAQGESEAVNRKLQKAYEKISNLNEKLERKVEALDLARKDAEKANRAKDDFLAILSHELRTPLTTILGWSQLLLSKPGVSEPVRDGLTVIERNAHVQGQLINDLLDVSRIQVGRLVLEARIVEVDEILKLAIQSIQRIADAKSVTIKAEFYTTRCMVFADPIRMQQVFWNLLTNAIKFTPSGGQICVHLATKESRNGRIAEIQVIDNGRGIKKEFISRIFDRFSQEDSSMARKYGGLGLGLTLVKNLVELQDGTVSVESQGEGKGSRFTVDFPLVPEENIPPPLFPTNVYSEFTRLRLDGMKLLIVDDDPDNLEFFDDMLRSSGAEVRLAESAKKAREMLSDLLPDVLISDISMPEEDGYSLIKGIRALEKEHGGKLPVIALTAYAGTDDVLRILNSGFSAHVAKPVEKGKLLQAIVKYSKKTVGRQSPEDQPDSKMKMD